MRNKRSTHKEVDILPSNAIKVSEYAKQWPCNTSYIYKLVSKGKHAGRFDIITFQGINFIVPCTN
jgi:hypothetical protein